MLQELPLTLIITLLLFPPPLLPPMFYVYAVTTEQYVIIGFAFSPADVSFITPPLDFLLSYASNAAMLPLRYGCCCYAAVIYARFIILFSCAFRCQMLFH